MTRKALTTGGKVIAVALMTIWSTFPIAYVVVSSFKLPRDIFVYPPKLTFDPTLVNYADLARVFPDFFGYMGNSVVIAVAATLLTVASALAAGYVYSRVRGGTLAATSFHLVGMRLLPPLVVTIPLFPWVNRLNLADTHLILIVLYATFWVPLCVLVMKEFIDQIPRELDESAIIDGATELQVLRHLILPLSAQGIVACAVFTFVFSWNEYLYAFIFTIQHAKTTPLVLADMIDSVTGTNFGILFAAATVQLVPVIVLVIVLQKFLVAGLTVGAVKG